LKLFLLLHLTRRQGSINICLMADLQVMRNEAKTPEVNLRFSELEGF
jgi:hypothetical protein